METCANCGANLSGPYCAQCGQEHIATEPTLRQVLVDMWEEFVKVDSKILATYKLLLTKPGQLTLDYFQGRRIRYVTPVKLYLTCSAIFFLVSNFSDIRQRLQRQDVIQVNSTSLETQHQITNILKSGTAFFFDHLSTIFIIMVPITALASALLFRGRKKSLLFHLVLVLHAWSALFLFVTVLALLHLPITIFRQILLVSAIYMVPTTRRVFRAGWGEAIFKSLAFGIGTLLLSITALVAIMAVDAIVTQGR